LGSTIEVQLVFSWIGFRMALNGPPPTRALSADYLQRVALISAIVAPATTLEKC